MRSYQLRNLLGTALFLIAGSLGCVTQGSYNEIQDGIRVDVSNQLLFASGSAILSEKGREVILRLAKQLRQSDETISVDSQPDNVMIGAALESQYPSNWEPAGARAARVVRRLSAEGVDPRRL